MVFLFFEVRADELQNKAEPVAAHSKFATNGGRGEALTVTDPDFLIPVAPKFARVNLLARPRIIGASEFLNLGFKMNSLP